MLTYYTDIKSVQILISLLKEYEIKRVVVSPGTTNIAFVASIQNDAFFEVYSSVDERSAAYIACGMAEESGEPVVITCTGATASRNYMSGLTEAYYRKLPIIAVTCLQSIAKVGHNVPQLIDRSSLPNDVALYSAQIPLVKDAEDIWECEIKINTALLECRRNGGGPVHLNLITKYSPHYDVKELPKFRKIDRFTYGEKMPMIGDKKVGIYLGSHSRMSKTQIDLIDDFCATNNAVVFCDHTSGYWGKYAVHIALLAAQENCDSEKYKPYLSIHIGEVSGAYYNIKMCGDCVWRVSPDGKIKDTFGKLTCVFEMTINCFFSHYINENKKSDSYLQLCLVDLADIRNKISDLPLSNIWVAQQLSKKLPENSTIHFGILNSLRAWNFFALPNSVTSMSNVGGFGIDGGISTVVGASLCNSNKLYYIVLGDLAFFYDINVLGNRHVGNNLRILLINNGNGIEFRNYSHPAAQFGEDADRFMAAGKHFGNKSKSLVRNFAKDIGCEYLTASSKEEFLAVYERFVQTDSINKSIIFEVFTETQDETDALKLIRNIDPSIMNSVRNVAKNMLGSSTVAKLKGVFKR